MLLEVVLDYKGQLYQESKKLSKLVVKTLSEEGIKVVSTLFPSLTNPFISIKPCDVVNEYEKSLRTYLGEIGSGDRLEEFCKIVKSRLEDDFKGVFNENK